MVPGLHTQNKSKRKKNHEKKPRKNSAALPNVVNGDSHTCQSEGAGGDRVGSEGSKGVSLRTGGKKKKPGEVRVGLNEKILYGQSGGEMESRVKKMLRVQKKKS